MSSQNKRAGIGSYVLVATVALGIFLSGLLGYLSFSGGAQNKIIRMHDISTTLDSGIIGDFFENHYLEQSLRYSLWQISSDLASEGGGFPDWSEDIPNIEDIRKNMEMELSDYPYFKDFSSGRCKLEFGNEFDLEILEPEAGDSFRYKVEKDPIEITCRMESVESSYLINSTIKKENPGNRLFYLWQDSHDTIKGLKSRLEGISFPTDYSHGSFLYPVRLNCKGGTKTSFKDMTGCTPGKASNPGRDYAKIIAELSAEGKNRYKIKSAFERSKRSAKITEGTSFDLENRKNLWTPSIDSEVLKEIFPERLGDLEGLGTEITKEIKNLELEKDSKFQELEAELDKVLKNNFDVSVSLPKLFNGLEADCKIKGEVKESEINGILNENLGEKERKRMNEGLSDTLKLLRDLFQEEIEDLLRKKFEKGSKNPLKDLDKSQIIDKLKEIVNSAGDDQRGLKYSFLGIDDKKNNYKRSEISVPCEKISLNQMDCPSGCNLIMKFEDWRTRLNSDKLKLHVNSTDHKYVLPTREGYKHLHFNFTYSYSFE